MVHKGYLPNYILIKILSNKVTQDGGHDKFSEGTGSQMQLSGQLFVTSIQLEQLASRALENTLPSYYEFVTMFSLTVRSESL